MPIVLSYNDVNALGQLAYQSGSMYGASQRSAQDTALLAQIDASRNATAAQLQGIQANERQTNAALAQRADQATAEQQYRYAALGQQAQQSQAALDAAQSRSEQEQQNIVLRSALQGERDKQLQQATLDRIEREKQLGSTRFKQPTGAAGDSSGLPTKQFAQQEVQDFGALIPFDAGNAVSADQLGRTRDQALKTAESLSSLPTSQLETYLQQRPNDSWSPYLRAVIQARQAISGGGQNPGSMAEGKSVPGRSKSQATAPLGGGMGFGDPLLQRLSDEDLRRLAENPQLLQQYLGGTQ